MEEKIKKFWKKHQYEIVLVGVGTLAGYQIAKRRYSSGTLEEVVDMVNDKLEDMFRERSGDFTNADGGYNIPQLHIY